MWHVEPFARGLRRLGSCARVIVFDRRGAGLSDRLQQAAPPTLEAQMPKAGEVLVSSTVRDLVAGSGHAFDVRGEHELEGVPGAWHLYAASAPAGDGSQRGPKAEQPLASLTSASERPAM